MSKPMDADQDGQAGKGPVQQDGVTMLRLRMQPQADMEEVCRIVLQHEAIPQYELLI